MPEARIGHKAEDHEIKIKKRYNYFYFTSYYFERKRPYHPTGIPPGVPSGVQVRRLLSYSLGVPSPYSLTLPKPERPSSHERPLSRRPRLLHRILATRSQSFVRVRVSRVPKTGQRRCKSSGDYQVLKVLSKNWHTFGVKK